MSKFQKIKERIQRSWRPKDDCGGGGGNQPEQAPQQSQEGQPQSSDSGSQQQQQGGQGGQGQPGQGGSQGQPSGKGQPSSFGNPSKGPSKVSMEEAKQAAQRRRERAKETEAQLKYVAESSGSTLKEFKSKINPSRSPKTDWWKSFYNRKNFLKDKDHNRAPIVYVEDGKRKSELVKFGNNPVENAEKYMRKLKQIDIEHNPDRSNSGWRSNKKMAGEDSQASDEDLEDSQLYQSQLNRKKSPGVFDAATGESIRKLNASFSVLASKIAEDAVSWPTIGDDEWDIYALMKRKYDKRPLTHCKQSREKSRLVLVLDTSGSCSEYSRFFQAIAQAALAFGDVEIYEAPNAFVTHKLIPDEGWLAVSTANSIDWKLRNRHIVFFGDWDGAARVIHNSQHNKLYWFDCDERQDEEYYLNEYVGMFGYTYANFKGKRFPCYTIQDFMRLVKKIK